MNAHFNYWSKAYNSQTSVFRLYRVTAPLRARLHRVHRAHDPCGSNRAKKSAGLLTPKSIIGFSASYRIAPWVVARATHMNAARGNVLHAYPSWA